MADSLTLNLGHSGELYINLANSDKVNAVQFDFYLPEGLEIAMDEEGSYVVETTERSAMLITDCEKMDDGKYRVLLYSMKKNAVTAGEGAIIKIKITCPKEFDTGNYDMGFSNIHISRETEGMSVNENEEDFTAILTVVKVSTISGDANGDFEVNITDAMNVVDVILDRAQTQAPRPSRHYRDIDITNGEQGKAALPPASFTRSYGTLDSFNKI